MDSSDGVVTSSGWRESIARWAPVAGVTLLWCAVLASPASLKPYISVILGVVTGALVLLAVAPRPMSYSSTVRRVSIGLGIGLAALAVGVFAHPLPLASLVGAVGQHNGWLLWAIVTMWFMVGAGVRPGSSFRFVVWSVAALGAVAGASALLDAAHVFETVRYSPEVAGLMESSVSLGQVLLVGLGAAVALAFMERSTALRAVAGVVVLVEIAALAVSGARTAQALFVAAVLVGALWGLGGRLAPTVRKALWTLVGLAVAAVFVGIGVIAWLGPSRTGAAVALLTDRPTIWHSAIVSASRHLLVGAGPDRFTSIVTWGPVNGSVTWQTTASPHNVLLDWLLGGGVVALVAFFSAFVTVGVGIARRLAEKPIGPKALALGVGAWAISLLMAWTDPLTACMSALVAGALLAETGAPVRATPRLVVAGAALAGACAILVLASPLFVLERGWAADQRAGSTDYATLAARWEAWPDPAFGGEALRASLMGMPASAETAGRVAGEVLDRTPWDTNGAIASLEVAVGVTRLAPLTEHPSVDRALAVGRAADPASGIWDRLEQIVKGK